MKKLLALLLSLVMVICMMPSMAFANGEATSLSSAVITLVQTEYTYTGKAIKPEIKSVKLGEQDVDLKECTISYSNNINAGSGSSDSAPAVTITANSGSAKYNGSCTAKFTIKGAKLSDTVAVMTGSPTVPIGKKGDELKAYFTLKFGDLTVSKDEYKITEDQVIKAGSNSYTITAANKNFEGQTTIALTGGKELTQNEWTVDTNNETFIYDGNLKTFRNIVLRSKSSPTVTLTNGVDFYVSYSNNKNAGTANYTIIGQGSYAGEITGTFQIMPRPMNSYNIDVSPINNQSIGDTPDIKIYDRGITGAKPLVRGTDYTYTVSGNDRVGTAKVTIVGQGNYTGSIERTFQVKDSLKNSYVSYIIKDYDYTGNIINPSLTVKYGAKTCVLNRDYKIIGGDKINAGTYSFSLVGMGDYGGEFYTGTYTIKPKNITAYDTTVSLPDSVIYDGKIVEPYVTVVTAGRTLVKNVDYSISYLNNDKIGTATVFIYGKGNYAGSVYKTFKILGKNIETASATLSNYSYSYTGLEHKPTVTVYDGTKRLTSGVDYTVDYKNNKNCGSASAIITGKGSYYGTKTLTFDIIGKDQTITTGYTYYTKYLTSSDFNLGAKTDGDGTLIYVSSDPKVASVDAKGIVTVNGTGIAYITVSSKNDVKFNPGKKVITVTVKPLKPVIKVTSPAKKQVEVQITKVKGATKYQINYGRAGKYYNKYITHIDNGYSTVTATIGNRTSGKNYFIKVRAYKTLEDGTKVWGGWTAVKKIKSK